MNVFGTTAAVVAMLALSGCGLAYVPNTAQKGDCSVDATKALTNISLATYDSPLSYFMSDERRVALDEFVGCVGSQLAHKLPYGSYNINGNPDGGWGYATTTYPAPESVPTVELFVKFKHGRIDLDTAPRSFTIAQERPGKGDGGIYQARTSVFGNWELDINREFIPDGASSYSWYFETDYRNPDLSFTPGHTELGMEIQTEIDNFEMFVPIDPADKPYVSLAESADGSDEPTAIASVDLANAKDLEMIQRVAALGY